MPYVVRKQGAKWTCLNPETEKVFGEHDTEEAALAQARALYVNAPPEDEKKDAACVKEDGTCLAHRDAAENAFLAGQLEAEKPDDEPDEDPDDKCERNADGVCTKHKDGKCKAKRGDATSESARKAWDTRGRGGQAGDTPAQEMAQSRAQHRAAIKHHENEAASLWAIAQEAKRAGDEEGRIKAIQAAKAHDTAASAHSHAAEAKGEDETVEYRTSAHEMSKRAREMSGAFSGRSTKPRRKDGLHGVRRFDFLDRLDGPVRMANGWLKFDAAPIARIGIQEYRRGDGSLRRELRLPDEVFHSDALASFAMMPVTDDHPPDGLLTDENTRRYQRGHLGERITQDGAKVVAPVLITDRDLVQKVLDGKTQLSCGYVCDLDETPGEYEGQRFDAVQRGIRGNHVAVVARARGGPELRLKLDSADAVSIRADRGPDEPLDATTAQERTTMTVKMQIDGIEVEVANEQAAQLIGRSLQAKDQRADAAEKALAAVRTDADKAAQMANAEKEQLRARATVAEAKITELEKARKDAEDAVPDLIRERVQLLEEARGVLGPDAKFDKLDALSIKRTVCAALAPEIKLDGEKAEFVDGIYRASLAAHRKAMQRGGLAEARRLQAVPGHADGVEVIDAEAARVKARKDAEEEWKKPLSAAK